MNVWLKDSALYSVTRLLAGIVSIVTIPIIVSLAGIETYGKYSQYLSLVNFISILTIGGVNQIYLRNRNAFSSPFELLSITLVFCFIITLFFSFLGYYPFLFSIGLSSMIFYSTARVVLQADRMIGHAAISETLKQLAMLLSALALSQMFQPSVEIIIIALIISNLVYMIAATYNFLPLIKVDIGYTFGQFSRYWKYGAGILIWSVLAALLPLADRLLIPYFVSESMLGPYTVIADLGQKISSILILPLAFSVLPLRNSDKFNVDFFKREKYFGILLLSSIGVSGLVLVAYWVAIKLGVINDFSNQIALSEVYFLCLGLILLQMSILAHKIFEINDKTSFMVIYMAVAIAVYFLVILSTSQALGMGSFYLANILAGFTYIVLCACGARNV